MHIIGGGLSPGRGFKPRDPRKRKIRERNAKAAKTYAKTVERERGFNASQGAASDCKSLDPNSPEFAEIAARLNVKE